MTEKTTSRQAIVAAAGELIRTRGVQGMAISELIVASGTSAGAIYHHFPNRTAIVVEVARTALAWPLAALNDYRHRPASSSQLLGFAMVALVVSPELGELLTQLVAPATATPSLS